MIKHLHAVALALALAVLALAVPAVGAQTALPESLRFLATYHLFESIGSTRGFNLQKPATYIYFFSSEDGKALKKLRSILEQNGYIFAGQQKVAKLRVLQMSKIEIHNVNSMVERNRALFALAKSKAAANYDGWEIANNEQ